MITSIPETSLRQERMLKEAIVLMFSVNQAMNQSCLPKEPVSLNPKEEYIKQHHEKDSSYSTILVIKPSLALTQGLRELCFKIMEKL